MPDPRTSKSLSARVDRTLPTRPSVWRRARRIASWSVAAVAGFWLLWKEGTGDDTIYHAGSVSTAHRLIANDCQRCHRIAWQPVRRLLGLNNAVTSTPDDACSVCHSGPLHNDHAAAKMANCSHCHREHHGAESLTAVHDAYCTTCHAQLPRKSTTPWHFAAPVPSFAEHPEFALFRHDVPVPETPGDEVHGVYRVAERDPANPRQPWRDRTALRFNHHKHLQPTDPRGLPAPPSGVAERAGAEPQSNYTRLDCESCHQADGDGRYFRPIAYDSHCRRCHPLAYDAALELGDPLPHRDIELVRSVMRSRFADLYARLALTPPANAPSSDALLESGSGVPGLSVAAPLREGELAWVNQRLAAAEHVVLGKEAKGGCRFCHTVHEAAGVLSIAPTRMPGRWQEHARFNHQRHRSLVCTACHDGAAASSATADILLPRIASCRACHDAKNMKSGSARSNCVECHQYHDHRRDSLAGQLSLDLLPTTAPPRNSDD